MAGSLHAVSRPRLSIIVSASGEEPYLRECLLSILAQSFRDVEATAVVAGAEGPDVRDERLVVHRRQGPVDAHDAVNEALEKAAGDYVLFAAPADRLAPGALAAIVARLDALEPDVLAVEEARAWAPGRESPGRRRTFARNAPAAAFTLEEEPAAAELGLDVRGRIFRRAFLLEHGLRFVAGAYGHLSLTLPALFAAERIAVLDRVGYVRLDPLDPPAGSPLDVFDAYDAVFGTAGPRSRLLAAPMLRHYLDLYDALPAGERAEFFARMSESYRRHAGGAPPRGPRARLVAGGRERTFRAAGWVRARRAAARRRVGRARRLDRAAARGGRRLALRAYYRAQLRAPLDPALAVFAAYWYRGYACNPRAIYERLAELVPAVRGVWVVAPEHAAGMPAGVDHVLAGSRAYYRLIARATYLVNNVNFPNELVKREGTIHVQTHHGSPVKTMGLDLREAFVAGRRMDFERLLRRVARWDYSISANPFSTRAWKRAYPGDHETLEVGYPRNDALVNATGADVERIRAGLGIERGRRVVLFAPTHREYLRRYVPTADLARLADELGPETVILARVHYFYDDDGELQGAGRIRDVSAHPSVEELCLAADVLVTDYSSLLFDYAVLDRPIVVHAPDWEAYRTLRGTYLDLLAEPPGVVTRSDDELVHAFRSGAVGGDHAARLRAAFRARFCALEDGRAAERVVRRVWLDEAAGMERSSESAAARRVEVEA